MSVTPGSALPIDKLAGCPCGHSCIRMLLGGGGCVSWLLVVDVAVGEGEMLLPVAVQHRRPTVR